MRNHLWIVACLAIGCLGYAAYGDTVLLKNGDRLTGIIETLKDGKLVLKTDVAGTVTIILEQVATFSSDNPVTLQFTDGTILKQKVAADEPGAVRVEGPGVVQAQSVPLAGITAVNPPPKPKPAWKGKVAAGYTMTTGNSETTAASVDIDLIRRTDDDRITVTGYYLYGTEEDDTGEDNTTKDKWAIFGKYDYFITKRFYAFVNASYEKDRIANLEARAIGGGGVGYQWIESLRTNYNTDVGLALMHEQYENPDRTNNTVVAQLGHHFDHKLTDKLTFLHDLRAYPDLQDLSNYKIKTSAELRTALTKAIFLSMKVALDHDSDPAPGVDKTDVSYILSLGVSF